MASERVAQTGSIHAVEENVEAIKEWDRALLLRRSWAQRLSDRITLAAASGTSMGLHLGWFASWMIVDPIDRVNSQFETGSTEFAPSTIGARA